MGNKWTEEQNRAITERGRNILVSAGAGSGKTAVMVERVVRLVIDDMVPVSGMLIVTFTKAAASEMKERLRKALKDKMAEASQSGDREMLGWVRAQIESLQTANISTFHSFASRVLKDFFYLTDIEPGFRVLDEAEAEVLKEEALDELFEAEYDEGQDDFRHFLDAFAGETNDEGARAVIRELYKKLEAVPDRFDVLDQKVEELRRSPDEFRKSESYSSLKSLVITEIRSDRDLAVKTAEFLEDQGFERLGSLVREDASFFDNVIEVEEKDGLDKVPELLKGHRYITMALRKDEKESYTEDLKNTVTAIRNDYKAAAKRIGALYYDSLDNMIDAVKMSYADAKTLERLVKGYSDEYTELKRELNAIDYSDMEHYALAILNNEDARNNYRNLFDYIFVDEYQDTNFMQETIISLIARDNNLFMVGDIKQSIYHFRLADPDIFKDKYARYKKEGQKGEKALSVKIDLNRNFRSKERVINEVNKMFRPLMDGYDKDAELVCGIDTDESKCEHALPAPETHIVDLKDVQEVDDEILDMRKEELEAKEAARIISDLIGKEYVDSNSREIRTIGYRDIVILLRSVKRSAEGYRAVFRKEGIPLYIDDRAGYFDTIEINVFLSLLSIVDNKRQDVPFLAVLRSEIFGFSCEELATIRALHKDGTFVEAAMETAEDNNADEALRSKCRNVFECIQKWQAYSVTLPLPDFIWRLMNETGYYIIAGALPNGASRQANLRLLADKAKQYSDRSFGSLYGFIQYIKTLKANNVDAPQATLLSENDDVVRIMTIHHSKGLEFPVVIVAGMDNEQRGGRTPAVLFDRGEGLGLKAVDTKRHLEETGLISRLIKAKDARYDVEELQRILYVAVTRARETFFLLGAADFDSIEKGLETGHHTNSTFLRMSRYLPNIIRVKLSDFDAWEGDSDFDDEEERHGTAQDDLFVEKRLGFRYPYSAALNIAAKTTVTSLNKQGMRSRLSWGEDEADSDKMSVRRLQDEEESKAESAGEAVNEIVPEFIRGREKMTAAHLGTLYHRIMQEIDFVEAEEGGEEYVRETINKMVQSGIFDEEDRDAVDLNKICKFFDTGIGRRAVLASSEGKIYKEQTFELKVDIGGEDVLVQGVIDCYFEEDDKIILMDYKTNRVDRAKPLDEEKNRIRELYRTQLDIYQQALEKALGRNVSERYLYLFSINEEVEV